jgi:two-component system KDP operon response regulator KdpE
MSEPQKIVVIEDEPAITKLIRSSYSEGTEVLSAESAATGIKLVAKENPDVVILDLGLPDMDGQDVCRSLREWTQVPIIVLSARGQEKDKVLALDNGADDYMTKPFSTSELHARVRTALRHAEQSKGGSQKPLFESGPLRVDLAGRQVFLSDTEVHLTPIEYKLLATLVRHAGMVLTHRQLLTEVWGPAYADELHYLRVFMGQLRRKLEPDPARPKLIRTESGIGYRLLTEA